MDLEADMLPDGALSMEVNADKATVSALRNIGLNLVMLPSEFLHTLEVGVIVEIIVGRSMH